MSSAAAAVSTGPRVPDRFLTLAAPALLATLLISFGVLWERLGAGLPPAIPPDAALALLKLMAAASIGLFLTAAQRQASEASRPLDHAQVLIALAGALLVMVIGDSLARAVGIVGGASLIRFRTPIDDPKDAAVLFLVMGLGMATGLGHFALAGLATLVLALLLPSFRNTPEQRLRSLTLHVVSQGPHFPSGQVESVLRRYTASFEPREMTRGERPAARYQVSVDPNLSLGDLSRELMEDPGAPLHSLAWDTPKKERYL